MGGWWRNALSSPHLLRFNHIVWCKSLFYFLLFFFLNYSWSNFSAFPPKWKKQFYSKFPSFGLKPHMSLFRSVLKMSYITISAFSTTYNRDILSLIRWIEVWNSYFDTYILLFTPNNPCLKCFILFETISSSSCILQLVTNTFSSWEFINLKKKNPFHFSLLLNTLCQMTGIYYPMAYVQKKSIRYKKMNTCHIFDWEFQMKIENTVWLLILSLKIRITQLNVYLTCSLPSIFLML